jgi:threonine dehydrogenase-like Zn-dependent dehydrogenase
MQSHSQTLFPWTSAVSNKPQNRFILHSALTVSNSALVEPLSVAWHAVSRSPLQEHDTVLVVGAGPIGLAIIQVLRAKGISNIIAVEVSERRREFALTLGAMEVLNPLEVDAVARVRSMTGDGGGAAIAFECSGVQAGLDTAMQGLRVRGTTVIVSLWEHKPIIDAFAVVLDEKHVTGAAVFDDGDFEAVIDAIASGMFACPCILLLLLLLLLLLRWLWADFLFPETGKIQPRPMITSKIPMEDVNEKGFKALIGEKDKHVKILVDISA